MEQKRKLVLMGNDAVGEAALRCGCTFFAGYPISPQTQILDYLAREMPKRSDLPIDLATELLVAAFCQEIAWWVKGSYAYSPEQVAQWFQGFIG